MPYEGQRRREIGGKICQAISACCHNDLSSDKVYVVAVDENRNIAYF
jgi:hypothetical protein